MSSLSIKTNYIITGNSVYEEEEDSPMSQSSIAGSDPERISDLFQDYIDDEFQNDEFEPDDEDLGILRTFTLEERSSAEDILDVKKNAPRAQVEENQLNTAVPMSATDKICYRAITAFLLFFLILILLVVLL